MAWKIWSENKYGNFWTIYIPLKLKEQKLSHYPTGKKEKHQTAFAALNPLFAIWYLPS